MLHDRCLARAEWPASGGDTIGDDQALWHWIATNHLYNSRPWSEEDLARRTRVGDAEIAANKRAIDGFNQAPNDATERVDELLLIALGLLGRWQLFRKYFVGLPVRKLRSALRRRRITV